MRPNISWKSDEGFEGFMNGSKEYSHFATDILVWKVLTAGKTKSETKIVKPSIEVIRAMDGFISAVFYFSRTEHLHSMVLARIMAANQ